MTSPGRKRDTSWGEIAEWYGEHLEGEDTYHAKVVLPNLLRVLKPEKGMRVLDLACGEGFMTRAIAESGATVIGADIAKELIASAQKAGGGIAYHATPADKLTFATDGFFDAVVCVLALQNMQELDPVFEEVARVLKPGSRFITVLNHPVLRVPKRSSWEFDDKHGIQFRRLDGYYTSSREKMYAHPGARVRLHLDFLRRSTVKKISAGKDSKEYTWSFHRPLEVYFKSLTKAGFSVVGLEEWISHRTSGEGSRQKAEDQARKEFPLFLMLEARVEN